MLSTALALAAALPQTAAIVRPDTAAAQRIESAGNVGDLYRPAQPGNVPAILLPGGSEGGLSKGAAGQAALLATRGHVVLHLSYVGRPTQLATLKAIPVATFTRALDGLKAQPGVAGDRIGIVGMSKARRRRCWSQRAAGRT